MRKSRDAAWMLASSMMLMTAGTACGQGTSTGSGQGYPTKPIRMLTGAVGGSSDVIARIPYKGQGPAVNALLGGEVQLAFPSAGPVMAHVKAGKLRALGITSAEPSALFPGLPTLAASGVPGYESVQMSGVFAPARTPKPVIDQLNRQIVQVLNSAEVKERFASAGLEAVGGTPEQFAAKIKSEMVRMGKVIKDAGIREE